MQGQRGSQVGRGALLGESAKVRIQERKCRGAHASPSLCPASPCPSLENTRMKEEGEVGLEQLVCMPGTHPEGAAGAVGTQRGGPVTSPHHSQAETAPHPSADFY